MLYALCVCLAGERRMRKREREIRDKETVNALLERSLVGHIATVNKKGFPVIKPVNFVYWNGKVYIHSSRKGEKIEDIRREGRVCFEVDDPVAYVVTQGPSCAASYYYRSIIGKGRAKLVKSEKEKLEILERLMRKYQPEGGYGEIRGEILKKTAVIEVSMERITGKEKLG